MTAEEVAAKSIPKPVGRPKKVLTEAEIVASLVVKPKGRPRNLMEELEDSAVESLKEKSEKAKGGKKEERAIGEKRRVGRPAYTEEQREAADARKAAVEAEAQRLRDVEAEKERLRKEKVAQRLEAEWVEAARASFCFTHFESDKRVLTRSKFNSSIQTSFRECHRFR